jgi:predicted nucleotidyltransferase
MESLFFSTPEQKVMRLLLSEPTTAFSSRILSSRLKGVRGLGGVEGLWKVLEELQGIGLVDFVDNHRAVRLQDDNRVVQLLKVFAAICDLESLKKLAEPISTKGILFGSRANGKARSDSDYDLFVVSDVPEEVRKVAEHHPLGRSVEVVVWTPELYQDIDRTDPGLKLKLEKGIVLWGSSW